MATRSNICARQNDGTYKLVYCHWDGYLTHNGRILLEQYDTQDKIDELLSHGDMSALRHSCDKPEGHSYETPVIGHTIYYGRDGGEEGCEARIIATEKDALGALVEEYGYLWDGKSWKVSGFFSNGELVDLKDAVESRADEE